MYLERPEIGPTFLPELRISFAINFASLVVVSCLSENPRFTRPSKLLSISSISLCSKQILSKRRSPSNEIFTFFQFLFFSSILSPISFASVPRVSRMLENNILDFFVVTVDFRRGTRKRSDPRLEVESARRARFRLRDFQGPRVRLYPV